MRAKALIPLFGFLALCGLLAYGLSKDPRTLPSEMIDRPFPEFALPGLFDENKTISHEALKGDVTLVNIFGSWCAACVQEHPMLMQIAKDNEVRIWGVDWRDTRENGRRWLAHYGNPYAVTVFDAQSELAINLGVTGAPETFVVDAKGQIRYKHVGIITQDVWLKTLRPIIRVLEAEK